MKFELENTTLYQFSISHYCEKARWALDYKGIPYRKINLTPGLHSIVIKRKAAASTVPVLCFNDQTIQGSDQIIDYLDKLIPVRLLGFSNESQQEEARALEHFLDEEVGPLLRSLAYNILFQHRKTLIALWSDQGPFYAKAWLTIAFPFLLSVLRDAYKTDSCYLQENRQKFEKALNRLDRLYELRPFLVGERFSRVDLTVAALLAPLQFPGEHPCPPSIAMPDAYESFCSEHRERSVVRRVTKFYRDYRFMGTIDS